MSRLCEGPGVSKRAVIGILGLAFNPGSDDVRDTPAAKIIAALNRAGRRNIIVYDPVATERFAAHYDLACRFADSCEQIIASADLLAITATIAISENCSKYSGDLI